MNLVGLETNQEGSINAEGKWFEKIKPAELEPKNLHRAQLQRRLERGDKAN
jgi:hypothetical protein